MGSADQYLRRRRIAATFQTFGIGRQETIVASCCPVHHHHLHHHLHHHHLHHHLHHSLLPSATAPTPTTPKIITLSNQPAYASSLMSSMLSGSSTPLVLATVD